MLFAALLVFVNIASALALSQHTNEYARVWMTNCDAQSGAAINVLKEQSALPLNSKAIINGGEAQSRIDMSIDIGLKLQRMEGFGAGLPQASASVLFDLKQTQPTLYEYVLQTLFGPVDNADVTTPRAGMNVLRFPIGSCDFSLTNTSYDEVKNDFSLKAFRIDDDSQKYIVSVLQDVKKINPELHLIGMM